MPKQTKGAVAPELGYPLLTRLTRGDRLTGWDRV